MAEAAFTYDVIVSLRVTPEASEDGNSDMNAQQQAESALEAAVATGLVDGFTVQTVGPAAPLKA